MTQRLILASGSPRRRELLRQAGYVCEVIPPSVAEEHDGSEPPARLAERLALEKAREVARRVPEARDAVVLGADTLVVLDENTLGKPDSPEEAARMLKFLSGREHEVVTGVALAAPGGERSVVAHETTRVFFRALSDEEIREYVTTDEPLDKAGAYAIQGRASRFVTRVEGCYFNVVGLPVSLVDRLMREWSSAAGG